MGKANIMSKNTCAMTEDGNSDSRPRLIAVDRAEMMRHLDELETAMNQTLQDMRSLVEESKRVPLTTTVVIDLAELINLGEKLNKVLIQTFLLKQIFLLRGKIDDLTRDFEVNKKHVLKHSLELYKEEIAAGRWDAELQKLMRSIIRLYDGDAAEQREYWKQKLKDLEKKVCGQGPGIVTENAKKQEGQKDDE